MSDISEFGQHKPDKLVKQLKIALRLKCPGCNYVNFITIDRYAELLKSLNPKLPAQRAIVECTNCHMHQFILAARPRR